MCTYDRNSARRRSQRLRKPEALLASKQPLDHKCLARRASGRTIIQPAASWRGAARAKRKDIEIDLLFGDKMRRAAQLPTLSWHGRSSAVGLPPCSLPPQDLGRVLDGGPIRHGVDSQQLVVPGSPPTACTGIQQGCQLVCPAAGTFWWCWLSPFVLHPAPPMSPHDLLLLKRLKNIP